MMKRFKAPQTYLLFVLLLSVSLFAGCGDEVKTGHWLPSQVVSIAVTPAAASIPISGLQQFTATATYNDGTTSDVTASSSWTSGTTGIATVNSTSGVATGVASGTSVITATFGDQSGTATLTVTAATLSSIAVTPATASIPIDGPQPFTAIATYSDDSTSDVTASSSWISDNLVVATVNSTSGVATGVASGTSVITATFGGMTGTATLTVTTATLSSIAVTPAPASIPVNGTQPFTATATYNDNSSSDVTASSSWISDNLVVATVNSTSGVATGLATGTSVITAAFGGMTSSATLTVTAAAANPLIVNLGTAGDLAAAGGYAILAKTGVSTVPNSVVTGNVGLSPTARVGLTGWSLITEPTDTSFTSAQVVAPGKLFAADQVGGATTANLGTAVLSMEAAYTAAAGRTASSAATTNVGGGTLTGLTLTRGVYEWGGAVTIPTDLILSGSATDVWIFKVAGTLGMAAAKNVILSGGALPQNIFWQVSGVVTIGANTHFEGIILGQTIITFGNLASINGRLLAQTEVVLDATTVTQP